MSCAISEAIVTYPVSGGIDQPYQKYLFTHDGINYTAVQLYQWDQLAGKFPTTPTYTEQYAYTDNKVTSKLTQWGNGDVQLLETYEYAVDGEVTTTHVKSFQITNGQQTPLNTWKGQHLESPSDGMHVIVDPLGNEQLTEFQDGNIVKIAIENESGAVNAFGKKWTYVAEYVYDNRPNPILRHRVLRELLTLVPNGGYCKNNVTTMYMIAENGEKIEINQQLLFTADRLDKYIYEGTGRAFTLSYQCK